MVVRKHARSSFRGDAFIRLDGDQIIQSPRMIGPIGTSAFSFMQMRILSDDDLAERDADLERMFGLPDGGREWFSTSHATSTDQRAVAVRQAGGLFDNQG